MTKKDIVTAIVNWTDGWNREIHDAVQIKVHAKISEQFPNGTNCSEEELRKMKEFYYTRLSNTANVIVAISAFIVSCAALIVSIIALKS